MKRPKKRFRAVIPYLKLKALHVIVKKKVLPKREVDEIFWEWEE